MNSKNTFSRRNILITAAYSLPLFALPCYSLYSLQLSGYGSLTKTFLFNWYSPFSWCLIVILIHAGRQLFHFYNESHKPRILQEFIRSHCVIYAIFLGTILGYGAGSIHRFVYCHKIMDLADQVIHDFQTNPKDLSHITPTQLSKFLGIKKLENTGATWQFIGDNDHFDSLINTDLSVLVENGQLVTIVPYDLPIFLMSGTSEARLFTRASHEEHWTKKYAKQHLGGRIEIYEK